MPVATRARDRREPREARETRVAAAGARATTD
jgi:hypothetical protein